MFRILSIFIIYLGTTTMLWAGLEIRPQNLNELGSVKSFLDGEYKSEITTPDKVLGRNLGERFSSPEEIVQLVQIWAEQSEKMQLFQYGKTHENRPLYYAILSSAENLARLKEIQKDIQTLANPEDLSSNEAKTIIKKLPATAWMAYSIHGNEISGADAALATIYHLIASKSKEDEALLDDMIVFIDPAMNPDGRALFHKRISENRGKIPNIDSQSLLHQRFVGGRGNHYNFDLNRDFLYLGQPETRGRTKVLNSWYPQLVVDGHEMRSMQTYLFGPAREPINEYLPSSNRNWYQKFSEDQAKAFDQKGWRYYTGEWFENLYPGYSNYVEYRGSLHILYEQAHIAEDGVRKSNGNIETYMDSVHHQFVSTMTNLATLKKHHEDIYYDFYQGRRQNLSNKSPYGNRSFIVLPSANEARIRQLKEILSWHNIDWFENQKPIQVRNITDQLGRTFRSKQLPSGSMIIPNRQAEAPLIAALLAFDTNIKDSVIQEERSRNLRDGSSLMYDVTAWNITMMMGLPAWTVNQHFSLDNAKGEVKPAKGGLVMDEKNQESHIMFLANGENDLSVAWAARLMEQGVKVRVIDKDLVEGGNRWPRGSVAVLRSDNPNLTNLNDVLNKSSSEIGLSITGITDGLGKGENPDIGGNHFRLLQRPQIALLTGKEFSGLDYGSIWHQIDTKLGIRHSHLESQFISGTDLRRYNVLVMPHLYEPLEGAAKLKAIKNWVKSGGTLIAIKGAAKQIAGLPKDQSFSSVKLLDAIFKEAAKYRDSLLREWEAHNGDVNQQMAFHSGLTDEFQYPWQAGKALASAEELERRDSWNKRFKPSGAFLAGRVDQKHWLSFGAGSFLPLLYQDAALLMSDDGSEAVIRAGVYVKDDERKKAKTSAADQSQEKDLSWYSDPANQKLILRMSGLLWQESAIRIANTAYLVREAVGQGQIIYFADTPNFRGASHGTARLLLNSLVFGPGLGASSAVEL